MRLSCVLFSGLLFAVFSVGAQESRRGTYFPNTEVLGPAEMRVIALGTGTPHIRPSQASTSWLVELGNGDKFLFDIGTSSLRNFSSLIPPRIWRMRFMPLRA